MQSSRQRIWEAFYDLATTMPFNKITVEKVVERSGLSKATFYRHFRDKYDVLNYNALAITERIIGGQPCRSWRDFFLFIFREIEREMGYHRKAFNTSGQNAHSEFLFEYSYSMVRQSLLMRRRQTELRPEEHYMIVLFCRGCVCVIEDWLRDLNRPSCETMADIFYAMMPANLRDTWLDQSVWKDHPVPNK